MNFTNGGHTPVHTYVSTACWHDHHDQCRRLCKWCPALCLCKCHGLYPSMEVHGTLRPESAEEMGITPVMDDPAHPPQ